jgi:CubicO group peptidase (beta-lactamase class C family)
MKRLFLIILIVALNLLGQSNIAQQPDMASELELLSVWIKEQITYNKIPGIAIGIVDDQNLIWAKGFGFSDMEKKIPMTPETLCRIASITKTFTATAIMQLRDQGKLRLDDPITKYLSWFKIKNRFTGSNPITIENLLTHTSGLPGEAAFPYWTDHQFPTREQLVEALPNQEMIQEPWSKYRYSNLGLALAGEIVGAVSGEPYEHYISKHILQPLAMTSTSVVLPAALKSRLAVSYDRRLPDAPRNKIEFPECNGLIPAANITSCVNDLAKYIAMHLRYTDVTSTALVKGSTLREMQRIHWLNTDWSSGWGLGFGVRKRGERTMVGHGGWVAGYKSHITFCPVEKIGVIVLMNCADAEPSTIAYRAYDMVAPLILKTRSALPAEPSLDLAGCQKYIGEYQDLWGWEARIMLLRGKLVLYEAGYPPTNDPEDSAIELVPETENTFRMSGANGNGELVRFIMDENNNVKRLYKGENYYLSKKLR